MPRPPRLLALSLPLAAMLAWAPRSHGQNPQPVPSSGAVDEISHEIEITIEREGATLLVTRSLFNAGPHHAQANVPIALPCSASLDRVAIQEHNQGGTSWRRAELLDPAEAQRRWWDWIGGHGHGDGATPMLDADTALHVTRDDWNCEAQLSIYPVPPAHARTVSYRVFVPSTYVEGRYAIELPSFDNAGMPATLELAGTRDPAFSLTVDGQSVSAKGRILDGSRSHTLELQPRDRGRAHASAADLDLGALIAATPAAAAKLSPDTELPNRLLAADFEAPSELVSLPPVRRVVVLIDASRSLEPTARQQLQTLAGSYLEQLGEDPTMRARAEVLLFDRELRRTYYDFVPAAWAGEDLPKLDIEARNGSEVGDAIAYARELLASESETEREGADWIVVLSDLYLRSDFSVEDQQSAARASAARMHVIRSVPGYGEFGPADADDPWTAVARAAGGMQWEIDPHQRDHAALARELISPTRIWSLSLELELADGGHARHGLERWLATGASRRFIDHDYESAALVRAAFVGEVWGQRRAWTATPTDTATRRLAASLATTEEHGELSKAARAALAYYAEVVSPFTSAWALASFQGPPPALRSGFGVGCTGGSSYSSSCGGGLGLRGHRLTQTPVSFQQLALQILHACPDAPAGAFEFETTDLEIVAVDSPDRCLSEQTWQLDIAATHATGRKRIRVEHGDGKLTALTIGAV